MKCRSSIRGLPGTVAALTLLVCLSSAGEAETNGTHFYFVQVTDTHFGNYDHETRTRTVVQAINDLPMPIECVVLTGDIGSDNLTDPEITQLALAVLGELEPPLHYLPGNHDIRPDSLARTIEAYTTNFGELCGKVDYCGVRFLFLYTEPLKKKFSVEGYDALAWLKSEITAAGNQPVLVFHHRPCAEDFYNNRMHRGWPADARTRWEEIIKLGNVRAVITGHFHRDELHWLDDVPVYVSAPVAGYWGRQGSFRVYEYDNGRLGYWTVYLEEEKEPAATMAQPAKTPEEPYEGPAAGTDTEIRPPEPEASGQQAHDGTPDIREQ